MPKPKLTLGPNDRKAELRRRGISQRSIADRLQVGESAVSHVLAGRNRSEAIETAIADALDMPRDRVFPPRQKAAA